MINEYTLFIDESGVGNLNNMGATFILSTIMVKNDNLPVIQGYLKMLKRSYFADERKNLHATDLFERTYSKYRKLLKPTDKRHAFLERIMETSKVIPFRCAIYYVNKDKLRTSLGYKPYPKKKSSTIPADLPYEIAAKQAILDFVQFLKQKKCCGEIIIESRQGSDKDFVGYFDEARKHFLPRNISNPYAKETSKRINSLSIANKDYTHAGLELADLCSYTSYRYIEKDPNNRMKINMSFSDRIHSVFKNNSYVKASTGKYVIEVNQNNLSAVKSSKLV